LHAAVGDQPRRGTGEACRVRASCRSSREGRAVRW